MKLHKSRCGPFGRSFTFAVKMVSFFLYSAKIIYFKNLSISTGKRYCLMLYEEEGDEILSSIAANPNAQAEVRQFCISIMELLKMEGLVRDDKTAPELCVDEPNSKMLVTNKD